MNKSDSIKELATALSKAQAEIHGAVKDSANPFFKSNYADLASVIEAIRLPFAKHGLAYIQLTETSEADEVRVETVLTHSSGEWIASTLAVPVAKTDAQGYGSALTYARRYGLSAVAGVAAVDDDGNAAAAARPNSKGKGVISAPEIAWNACEPAVRKQLQELATEVREHLNTRGATAGLKWLNAANLDNDAKAAIWHLFDSKERAAMKNASAAEQVAA